MRRAVPTVLLVAAACLAVLVPAAPASRADEHARTPDASAVELRDYFTPEQIARASAYRGKAYALGLSALAAGLLVAGLLGLGRGSRALARWGERVARRWWTRALLLLAAVTAIPAVVTLPLVIGRHRHARAFGLATDTPAARLRDHAIAIGFEFVVAAVAVLVMLAAARRSARWWPVLVAPLAVGATVAAVYVFPVIVEPAFNRFTPADAATRARVLAVADEAGVAVDQVLVADASRRTSALNAYVSGLGDTRRVVLFDTLLRQTPPEELAVVVAHELAHVAHRDVLRGTAWACAGVVAGLGALWILLRSQRMRRLIGASAPGDPAVVPFLVFAVAVATLLTAPAASAISRDLEARADRFALDVTGEPQAMIDLQVRLARENLADLDPHPLLHWAFFSHPSTIERIAIARAYAAEGPMP